MIGLAASDRLLILAPHPDDESIATGGLLQCAHAAGAATRVVVLTDGDNNPWPQRWIEKRWHIGADERARWGARRREEARAAMQILGVGTHAMDFLGLPDGGLTELLMRGDQGIVQALQTRIAAFAPTLLVLPALADRHPDHSATHILTRLALADLKLPHPRLLAFAVHGDAPGAGDARAQLTPAQRDTKQAAILAHASQMALSRRRFLRHALLHEAYREQAAEPAADTQLPLVADIDTSGILQVRIDLRRGQTPIRSRVLFIVLECGDSGQRRWLVPLSSRDGLVNVIDAAGTGLPTAADVRHSDDAIMVKLCIGPGLSVHQGFVKLARPRLHWRVFDDFGWQVVVRT